MFRMNGKKTRTHTHIPKFGKLENMHVLLQPLRGAQIATETRIAQLKSALKVPRTSMASVCASSCERGMLLDLPTSTACGGIGIFYLRGSCGGQSPKGVQSVSRHITLSKAGFLFSKPLPRPLQI